MLKYRFEVKERGLVNNWGFYPILTLIFEALRLRPLPFPNYYKAKQTFLTGPTTVYVMKKESYNKDKSLTVCLHYTLHRNNPNFW